MEEITELAEIFELVPLPLIIAIVAISFSIVALFLRTLDKATLSIRTDNPATFVHRAWVWTQLIPVWQVIAIIFFHVKMNAAAKIYAQETEQPVPAYPTVAGWFFALGFLYSWIPGVGLVYVVAFIVFWVQASGFHRGISAFKYAQDSKTF